MRPLVAPSDDERRKFWQEIDALVEATPSPAALKVLKRTLPRGISALHLATRRKGVGSLGRPRYVAIATWHGGRILREAKAMVPSAWGWAHETGDSKVRFLELAQGAFRAPDPFLDFQHPFMVRRIAADQRKVELGRSEGRKVPVALLEAMGFDLGAIHAASRSRVPAVLRDLDARPVDWLRRATRRATATVEKDFEAWRASGR